MCAAKPRQQFHTYQQSKKPKKVTEVRLRLGSNEVQLIIKSGAFETKPSACRNQILLSATAQIVLRRAVIVLESHNGSESN